MELGMSVNASHLRLSNSRSLEDSISKRPSIFYGFNQKQQEKRRLFTVNARGKRGMQTRKIQRSPPQSASQIENDGNPKFIIFIRNANVYLWYPLTLITGGTTAKLMVAAKDSFVGKYLYKDTIAKNLAAVIYNDEKKLQKTALKQFRVLRSAPSFKYGYKLVEHNNLKAALSTSDIIELPSSEEIKTVLDKVKEFFGSTTSRTTDSFGKLTTLTSIENQEVQRNS